MENYYKNNSIFKGIQFEGLIYDIFKKLINDNDTNNYLINLPEKGKDFSYDFMITNRNIEYYIEVKYFNNKSLFNISNIEKTIEKFFSFKPEAIFILVLGTEIVKRKQKLIEKYNSLILLDVGDLLYITSSSYELKNYLISFLNYSVANISPTIPSKNFRILFPKITYSSFLTKGNKLIAFMNSCSSGKYSSKKYEEICQEVLEYLFNDSLTLWKHQKKSNANLYQFDLICKIKDNVSRGLWTTFLDLFNSKYIIFEFKNYSSKITQKEIYTTEKYLYKKAFRSVAIIISPKGLTRNGEKAVRGVLRESGKLILSITNDDIYEMISMKDNFDEPSDYLYDLFDNLLIDLEK